MKKTIFISILFSAFVFANFDDYAKQYETVSNISANADDLKSKLEDEIQISWRNCLYTL